MKCVSMVDLQYNKMVINLVLFEQTHIYVGDSGFAWRVYNYSAPWCSGAAVSLYLTQICTVHYSRLLCFPTHSNTHTLFFFSQKYNRTKKILKLKVTHLLCFLMTEADVFVMLEICFADGHIIGEGLTFWICFHFTQPQAG